MTMPADTGARDTGDPNAIKQITWSGWYRGVQYSKNPAIFRRFYITSTTEGFSVVDCMTDEIVRVTDLVAAKAWAGARVGERVVWRENNRPFN